MHLLLLSLLSNHPPTGATAPERAQPWRDVVVAGIRNGARAFRVEGERWVAASPEAGLRGSFDLDGARLGSSGGLLSVRTVGWGRPGAVAAAVLTGLGPGACALGQEDPEGACVRRLELRSVGFVEAWSSSQEGFEQSWIVDAPPAGAGDLVIDVAVEGAKVEVGDGELWLWGEDGEAWVVSGFSAWDTEGVPLSLRLEATADGYRVRLNDTDARYPVTVDPIYGTAATTLIGESAGDHLGYAVSDAGDINGDGYDDVLVRARGSGDGPGRIHVYHGSPSGVSTTADTVLVGETTGDGFGLELSGAGDVDGDGYDDVVVAAQYYDSERGRVYVYAGSASGVSTTAATTLSGEAEGDLFGSSVSGAGDVDSDGYDDVVVGALGYDSAWGRAYVYHGSASGLSSDAATTLSGEADDYEAFGNDVSGAGDVNGDGYDDVVVAAVGYGMYHGTAIYIGRAYVHEGSASGVSASAATVLEGEDGFDYFGWSLSGAGDVNGDGYDDVIVGAMGYDSYRGGAYVYQGSAAGLSTAATTLAGEADDDHFARSVSGAGDVNGDGYDDVIVGASSYLGRLGRAYVFAGSASGIATTATTTLTGEPDVGGFGWSVSGAGDVNGDGYDDLLVGSYAIDDDDDAGRAYIYHGADDLDGDGYLSVDDCDDADATVFPGADEVACDGVDQDCDGSDLRDGCDTGDPPDTDAETGDTDDSDTESATHDTEDTEPGDGHSAEGSDTSDTSDKEPPACGCASLGPSRSSLLLTLLSLLTLRRRYRHANRRPPGGDFRHSLGSRLTVGQ